MAAVLWSVGFPLADILLQSWGSVALVLVRQVLSVSLLLILWVVLEGWSAVVRCSWWKGIKIGAVAFGLGAILLMLGQKYSDAVTPAIAAAMMPIAGIAIEVFLDRRKIYWNLIVGLLLVVSGGYLATGVSLSGSEFGLGALLCIVAIILFAWGTRATARELGHLSAIGRSTITLVGGMIFIIVVFIFLSALGYQTTEIGKLDIESIGMLVIFSLVSMAIAQYLWIMGSAHLGVFLASFHLNAVPFFVMVIVVLFLHEPWSWLRAFGAGLVLAGVLVSQSSFFRPRQLEVVSV
jgi:drug/metabolite transporter (DMT)-like permease